MNTFSRAIHKSYVKHVASITEYKEKKKNAISNSTERHIGDTIYTPIFFSMLKLFSQKALRGV